MKHRALIIGAGRIGAGFNWNDDGYTHAGAYKALADRVELVGFVEPDLERRVKANLQWKVPTYDNVDVALHALKPDIVSICTLPEQQQETMDVLPATLRGIWCEKPQAHKATAIPTQINFMRRGDPWHRELNANVINDDGYDTLIVYGKDDETTRCHFVDLAKWWKVKLDYRPFVGPCAYILRTTEKDFFFDAGGVDGGTCFKAMLGNLLDHIDNGTPLWSPAT